VEVILLLTVIIGAVLLGWGLGWDQPAATLAGLAVLALATLRTVGVRLRPALLATVTVAVLALLGVVYAIRSGPAAEPPTAAVAVPAAPASPGPGATPAVPATPRPGEDPVAFGQRLATMNACTVCHTTDGRPSTGPTWRGLFGKSERLQGGGTVMVDEAYLRESIVTPNAKVVQGFTPVMPQLRLSESEVDALIAYIRSLR
jgi:cytochrome c1